MVYVSTGMGDRFGAVLVSLMALRLTLVDRNPFQPYYLSHIVIAFQLNYGCMGLKYCIKISFCSKNYLVTIFFYKNVL